MSKLDLLFITNLVLSGILLSLIPVGAVAELVSGGDNNSNFKLNR
jgi:hypothetical protein